MDCGCYKYFGDDEWARAFCVEHALEFKAMAEQEVPAFASGMTFEEAQAEGFQVAWAWTLHNLACRVIATGKPDSVRLLDMRGAFRER